MAIQTSELELIKTKLRSFSERYERLLKETNSTIDGMRYESWEKDYLAKEVIVRTDDSDSFNALFAEELKTGGQIG